MVTQGRRLRAVETKPSARSSPELLLRRRLPPLPGAAAAAAAAHTPAAAAARGSEGKHLCWLYFLGCDLSSRLSAGPAQKCRFQSLELMKYLKLMENSLEIKPLSWPLSICCLRQSVICRN
ncbi:hypothetical protein R6Z07F_017021 [Ovis aries]